MITIVEPVGPLLAGTAAVSALAYTIRKDAAASTFAVNVVTAQPGARSWPEGWPENWMESARPEPMHIDGAWYTHKPDYRIKQKLRALKHSGDEGHDENDDDYQTFFPFRIQWEQLKLDLEFTDKRLAREAAEMQKELTDFELRYKTAHEGYTKELSRAKIVTADAAHLNSAELETSSDPDLMVSVRENWVRTRKELKAERAAIRAKYAADVVSYNLRVGKARDVQPGLLWMRNVQIVELDGLPGRPAKPRLTAAVNATLTVIGGAVSDKRNGFVDVQLDWNERHRATGSYSWKSTMRINAVGKIESGRGKLYERFQHWMTAGSAVDPSKTPGLEPRIRPTATAAPSFVDEALRLRPNAVPNGLVIELVHGGGIAYTIDRATGAAQQMRIARTSRTAFQITNAKRMTPQLKTVLSLAFRSRGLTVTIED